MASFYFTFIFLSYCILTKKKSRVLLTILLLLLFILLGFEKNTIEPNTDFLNYNNSYESIGNGDDWVFLTAEPLYILFGTIGNYLHLSFEQARRILCIIEIFLLYNTTGFYTNNKLMPLALFFLYPGFLIAELFRFLMGLTIVIYGLPFLINRQTRRDVYKYVFFVIIASLAHASCFFFLIFLLILIKNNKILFVSIFGIIVACLVFSQSSLFTSLLSLLPIKESISDKYQKEELSNIFGVLASFIRQLPVYVIGYYAYKGSLNSQPHYLGCTKSRLNKWSISHDCVNISRFENGQILRTQLKRLNLVSIVLIGVAVFTAQVSRLVMAVLLLNYIALAIKCEESKHSLGCKWLGLTLSTILLLFALYWTSAGTMPVFQSHFREGYIINFITNLL